MSCLGEEEEEKEKEKEKEEVAAIVMDIVAGW